MNPLPHSHSALSDFKNCPKAYYHKRVAKDVPDPPNAAGQWGDYVHRCFEKYLKHGTPLPDDIPKRYKSYLDRIQGGSGQMLVECKYAIDKDLQPCDWRSPDVWNRAIIDVLHINGENARMLDHKTGKYRPNTDQLKLCALHIFIHHPEVNSIKTGYFWLKDTKLTTETFTRDDIPWLWAVFLPLLRQYKQAFHTMTFNPKPSGLCNGWCPVTDCEYWKPKRN